MWLKKKLIIFSSALGKQFFYWETKLVRHDAVLFFEAHHMVIMMNQVKCAQTVGYFKYYQQNYACVLFSQDTHFAFPSTAKAK